MTSSLLALHPRRSWTLETKTESRKSVAARVFKVKKEEVTEQQLRFIKTMHFGFNHGSSESVMRRMFKVDMDNGQTKVTGE